MPYSPRKAAYLEQQCLKEANRALRSSGGLSRDDLLHLRIQTCSPFERLFILACAVALGVLAAWLYYAKGEKIGGVVSAGLSVILLLVAFLGRKATVESVFKALDVQITSRILDALF